MDLKLVEEPGKLQGNLLQALAKEAGDPDLEAARWMSSTVPVGIVDPITPGGAFPEISKEEALRNVSRYAAPDLAKAE